MVNYLLQQKSHHCADGRLQLFWKNSSTEERERPPQGLQVTPHRCVRPLVEGSRLFLSISHLKNYQCPPKALDFGRRISKCLLLVLCTGSLGDEGGRNLSGFIHSRGVTCIFWKSLWVKKGMKPWVCSASTDSRDTSSKLVTTFLETILRAWTTRERRERGKSGEGDLTRNAFGSSPAAIQLSPSPPEGYLLFHLLLS